MDLSAAINRISPSIKAFFFGSKSRMAITFACALSALSLLALAWKWVNSGSARAFLLNDHSFSFKFATLDITTIDNFLAIITPSHRTLPNLAWPNPDWPKPQSTQMDTDTRKLWEERRLTMILDQLSQTHADIISIQGLTEGMCNLQAVKTWLAAHSYSPILDGHNAGIIFRNTLFEKIPSTQQPSIIPKIANGDGGNSLSIALRHQESQNVITVGSMNCSTFDLVRAQGRFATQEMMANNQNFTKFMNQLDRLFTSYNAIISICGIGTKTDKNLPVLDSSPHHFNIPKAQRYARITKKLDDHASAIEPRYTERPFQPHQIYAKAAHNTRIDFDYDLLPSSISPVGTPVSGTIKITPPIN